MAKNNRNSVMVFCAHSDDQMFGAGGALAKYAREGGKIFTVVFSFGEYSHPWLRKRVTIEIRVEESQRADKVIGIKYKPKVRYRKKFGHRQEFTKVKITKIT